MKAIKLIALTVTLVLAVSATSYAQGNEAGNSKSTTSTSKQINQVAVPKPPASPAYGRSAVAKQPVAQTQTSGPRRAHAQAQPKPAANQNGQAVTAKPADNK